MKTQTDLFLTYRVHFLGLVFLGLFLAAAFFYYPQKAITLGVVAGGLIAQANFWLLGRVVGKLLKAEGNKPSLAGLIVLKFLVLFGLAGVLLLKMGLNPLAFAIGFFSVIAAIFIEGLF